MKRTICILLCVVLMSGCMGGICQAKSSVEIFPIKNASPYLIVGAVENELARLNGRRGEKSTLCFPFSKENYTDLAAFGEEMKASVHPLINALFAADMSGRDYITVRCAYAQRSDATVPDYYYFMVTMEVCGDQRLERKIKEILAAVPDGTASEQVAWLQEYVHRNIQFEDTSISASGTFLALVEGRGVCMGYSRSMLELCRALNIPCFAVVNQHHMWNSVYLDGQWRMVDVTWNIDPCEVIESDDHEYDASLYRKTIQYMRQREYYRGKASACYMKDLVADWYRGAVEYCLGQGVFQGVSRTSFAPEREMSRGMVVTVLGRLAGAKARYDHGFVDVPDGQYYAGYVGWAKANGIVKGVSAQRFDPDAAITRQELCKMFYGFAAFQQTPLRRLRSEQFADHNAIDGWAQRAVYACAGAGLVQGKGHNRFDPTGTALRAEVAVILQNYQNFIKSSETVE